MKRLFLLCTALLIPLCLFACSSGKELGSVQVACDDFYELRHISQDLEIAVGDSLDLTLCSNPSTGFQWEEAQISDQTVLEQVDRKFVGPDGNPPPGTPGQEVWTFKALKAGESRVSIDYSRPWEGGEKGEWTFALSVVVK